MILFKRQSFHEKTIFRNFKIFMKSENRCSENHDFSKCRRCRSSVGEPQSYRGLESVQQPGTEPFNADHLWMLHLNSWTHTWPWKTNLRRESLPRWEILIFHNQKLPVAHISIIIHEQLWKMSRTNFNVRFHELASFPMWNCHHIQMTSKTNISKRIFD